MLIDQISQRSNNITGSILVTAHHSIVGLQHELLAVLTPRTVLIDVLLN